MEFRILIIIAALFLSGCATRNETSYNEQWSKAKNLTHSAGLDSQIYDQQLPASAYNKEGKLLDYKLGNISHPAYGNASGIVGVNVQPYGAFEHLYWGWAIPGASHHKEHRLFAWMPEQMAENIKAARETMEAMLSRAALAILEEMHYKHKPVKTPFEYEGQSFRQWYLGSEGEHCSLEKMNCVLSLYIPEPREDFEAPSFSFYSIASEPSWFFHANDEKRYPRLVLSEGDGMKSIRENVFYQKLSARLPGWVYIYLAPNEVGTGDENKTVAYPYLLEKGQPLLFVRPLK